jgi:hypothetical protein
MGTGALYDYYNRGMKPKLNLAENNCCEKETIRIYSNILREDLVFGV